MENIKCSVCDFPMNEKSHNHYGATEDVCPSCRNFFRRSVQREQYPDFQCRLVLDESGQASGCLIDSKSRMSCKKCRFKKCLNVGMRMTWVAPEGKGKQRSLQNEKENKHESPKQQQLPKSQNHAEAHYLLSPKPLEMHFTNEERDYSIHISNLFMDTINQSFYSVFSQHPEILHEWICTSQEDTIMTYELFKKLEWTDEMTLTNCAFNLLMLEQFTETEQNFLAHNNVAKIMGFVLSLFSEAPDMKFLTYNFIQYGLNHQDIPGVQNVVARIQQAYLPKGGLVLEYCSLYSSPWAPSVGIEEDHLNLTKTVSRWCRPSSDQMSDGFQMILMVMILLLSAEDCNLTPEQKSKIEQTQLKYVTMMHRYLKSSYQKEANTKLAGGLMILHHAKELFKMHSLRLPF